MARVATGLSDARPFAGLRAFDLRDAKFFFGREDQKAALYRLVDRNRFVAVVGSSGSGKSSLTRAGLFRLLQDENEEKRSAPWLWCALRPGDAPITALTDALTRLLPGKGDPDSKRDRIEHLLSSSTFGCADAVTEAGVDADARFVLVIDQFEELFRYSDQRQGQDAFRNARAFEEAQQFVELLLEASRSRSREIHVLITMRSDFIGECAQFSGLAEAVSATQFLVPGLTHDQLEEIICKPISLVGSSIDPDLVQQLLNESSKELDELPVLQHCLLQLWKRAGNRSADDAQADVEDSDEAQAPPAARHITMDDYDEVGRLSGALSKHANRILRGFQETQVAAVFRALSEIRNGRAIRRALPYAYLREETGLKDEQLRPIVDRFRADNCSFLLTSPANVEEITDKTRIDVCHEALLRRWEKCGGTADVVAAHQTGPAIGWLEQERRNGQEYQFLLSKAENRAGWRVEDIWSHRKWWNDRGPTERWTERYGGGYFAVKRMLRAGWITFLTLAALGVVVVGGLVGWGALLGYKINSAEIEARKSLDLSRDVLKTTLDDLNHGKMQVAAALAVEEAMSESMVRNPVKNSSSNIIALESRLNYTAADILWDAGKAEEALSRALLSQKQANGLHEGAPDNPRWQGIVCESTQRVGDAKELNRDYAGALVEFRRAQAIAEERGETPAEEGLCSDIDYYHSRAGDMLLKLGDPKGAHAEFEQALKIAKARLVEHPDNADLQASVPRYDTKLGQALAAQGSVDQALQEFDLALGRQKEFAKSNAALRSNLAISYFEKAKALPKPAGWDEAIKLYGKAIEIHQALVEKDRDKASWLSLLADEQHGLADAYRRPDSVVLADSNPKSKLAHLGEVVTAFQNERDTRERLAKIDENNGKLKEDLAKVNTELAAVQANYDAAKGQPEAQAEPKN